MEKETLISLIEQDLSSREIANRLDCSQGRIRYWLQKHKLKTKRKLRNKGHVGDSVRNPKCEYCGTKERANFYDRFHHECKNCFNDRIYKLSRDKKEKAVKYKGGECCKCGYKKCMAALDFHHIDPEEKDVNFRTMLYWKWERRKKEIDKCILVCSNCHRELHYSSNKKVG
jgi:hypothetical protein